MESSNGCPNKCEYMALLTLSVPSTGGCVLQILPPLFGTSTTMATRTTTMPLTLATGAAPHFQKLIEAWK